MTYAMKSGNDWIRATGNPTIDSLNGNTRAPLRTILAASWTDSHRAAYGVYWVSTTAPEGQRWTGTFADDDGVPVAVFEALPPAYATASEAKLAMTAWINRLTGQIQNEYPDVVQKGWEDEEAMALASEAGTMTQEQTDTLAADAAAKGRTPAEHATRILEKATAFRGIAGQTRTLWLATDKALDGATDPAQYEAILAAAIAQAAPLAAAYGLNT